MAVADGSPQQFLSGLLDALCAGRVDLPAFPQVVIKVQEVLQDPNYSPQTIARVISTERTLADRLLQMANSTAFNATGRVIIDLGLAVTRLGTRKVYGVALAHAIQYVRRDELLKPIGRQLEEMWTECVTVAHFSEVVAKRIALAAPGAFAAGLLHGIGRFYILVQGAKQDPLRPRLVVSQALIDEWHPRIGKAVLANWQLEPEVCDAVGAQSELHAARTGNPALTDVLIASIRLAHRLQNRYDTENLHSGGVFARLGLTLEACTELIDQATDDVRKLQIALRP